MFLKMIGVVKVKKYTVMAKDADNKGKWYVIDAEGAVLGRLATKVASHLRMVAWSCFPAKASSVYSCIRRSLAVWIR